MDKYILRMFRNEKQSIKKNMVQMSRMTFWLAGQN